MTAPSFKPIILSASGVGTYQFFTGGYQPPSQPRYIDQDVVVNQNGKFKWVYDNGPGFKQWAPFKIIMGNRPEFPARAATQIAQLLSLWNHIGTIGLRSPEGDTYTVIWADNALDKAFRIFPNERLATTDLEYTVTVQFEEAS